MRKLWFVLPLLLSTAILARAQALIGHQILAGSGVATPTAVAIDSQGFVWVAGNTTAEDFPAANALESQPPQGVLEVSLSGAAFANAGLNASTSTNTGNYGITAMAASSDGMLVIVSSFSGSYRSADGGVTWKPTAVALPQAIALAVDPVNPSNAYAIGPSGELFRSGDGGVTWLPIAGPPNLQVYQVQQGTASIAIDPQHPATLYVCSNATVYRSTDSAQSWQPLSIPFAGGPNGQYPVSAFALALSQPNVLYVTASPEYVAAPLYTSADGGATWTVGANVNVPAFSAALAVDPTNPSTVWVAATDQTVKKSTDGGATFQTITALASSPGGYSVAIDPANPMRVYAATFTNVFETTDGGATWSTVLSGFAYTVYAAPARVFAFSSSVPSSVFLAKFDPALAHVIYSTFLWAGSVTGIAVDSQDNVVLTGANAIGGIVMKVSAADNSVLYSTIVNGAQPNAIAIDAAGNSVIAGYATSLTTTKGAYQSAPPGTCLTNPTTGLPEVFPDNAFAAKLNATGALLYATYITGSCGSYAFGLALDSAGDAYLAGETTSPDFPVTQDAMIAQFTGGSSSGFVAKLSPAGDQLLYSSFVGGGNYSAAHAITLDGAGNIYLAGSTDASPTAGAVQALPANVGSCPLMPGGFLYSPAGNNAFVLKMTPSAAPAAFLATFGGSCQGQADSMALDATGNIWLSGFNGSPDFGTLAPIGGVATLPPPGPDTGFVAELNPTGSTLLSATLTDSYPGAVAADSTAVYYAGPLGPAALVAEIDPASVAKIFIDEIVQDNPLLPPTATRAPSPVAPGEFVRIIGRGIGPQTQASAKLTAAGTLATSIGGVTVTFNGVPAPLLSAQANLIGCIAPFELQSLTSAVVQVEYNGQTSNAYSVGVLNQNPDVLAVVNSDWSVNSASNPAKAGSQVVLFLTGLGQTVPPASDGAINQLPPAQLQTMPTIDFSPVSGTVTFIGAAVFEVAGAYQMNIVVPALPALGPSQLSVFIGSAGATIYVAP
jgi:uncharacterized protein (TIGR03437 family)